MKLSLPTWHAHPHPHACEPGANNRQRFLFGPVGDAATATTSNADSSPGVAKGPGRVCLAALPN